MTGGVYDMSHAGQGGLHAVRPGVHRAAFDAALLL